MKYICLLILAAALIGACDEDDNGTDLSQVDQNFVTIASESNRAQLELGQLAAERGGLADVKAYGSMMVTEHNTFKTELEALANSKRALLTTDLDRRHTKLRDTLAMLSGRAFDSIYVSNQLLDQQELAYLTAAQQGNSRDNDYINFAKKWQPKFDELVIKTQELKSTLMPSDTL